MGFLGSCKWYAAHFTTPGTTMWITGGNVVEMQLVGVYKLSFGAPMKKAAPKSGFF
jgi:hypothetical protein